MSNEPSIPAGAAASSLPPVPAEPEDHHSHPGHHKAGFAGLALGSVGVVYGDIGTSPLYALKESLHHTARDGIATQIEVIGVVSLLIWALIIVVTLKYVVFIMRADNKGEGGTLSLMALAQTKMGRSMGPVFMLGVIGAALFYGDSIITPAISVLSAVEGLKQIDSIKDTWIASDRYIVIFAVVILVALFAVQSRGTGKVAAFFGPIMVVWFLTLAVLGIMHIGDDLVILNAFNPYYAGYFLANHGIIGLIVLGSVFLAVTGAEALYADMGHFGRNPIRAAWLALVFPSLVLNYLGQGALILKNPTAMADRNFSPFYAMAPEWLLVPFIALALLATIIASQAVITGAFSLTQQAVQLGLLPRLEIRHTSETQRGQIYLPQINWLLMIGVLVLVVTFRSSSSLANAYGIAVTGAMLADAGLFYIVTRRVWGWAPWRSFLIVTPFIIVDCIFFGANLLKLFDGAYMPLIFGSMLIILMWTWVRGSRIVYSKERRDSLPVADLFRMLEKSQPVRVKGTAVFLTSDPENAPSALLHNLKHNKVLHQRNIILTIKTLDVPWVPEHEQIKVSPICSDEVTRIIARVGYMQSPRVPRILTLARRNGLDFDIMQTSFFLGRRTIKASRASGMPIWQDNVFIFLSRMATNATDFFHIPTGRVVEMGSQVTV
ncbi:MAG: potassium transporter Kup [Methylocystis sp.]|nr:potassium transporter Kup [Methylocystis sp.]MCA3582811.1 potassium transporter Kup [Methylocystis sp.]MCA3586500.1 potassium transporter Kup [Methylocystis sp.]MCA3592108.1 potassium transporter Kup [Methylocystis sp.]